MKTRPKSIAAWTIEGIQNIRKLFKQWAERMGQAARRTEDHARQEEQEADAPAPQSRAHCGWKLPRKLVG